MAASSLVLCSPLCFLLSKYRRSAAKHLKSAISDFYSVEDLDSAKRTLLHDVDSIRHEINLQHIPERREGQNRADRIVDDIFVILSCLDENLKLDCLPRYVSDNPDMMPSIRLYEGDMVVLMKSFEKMENRMTEFGSKLAAIASEVQSLQVQSTVNRLATAVVPESRGQRQHQQTLATRSAVVSHTKEVPPGIPSVPYNRVSDQLTVAADKTVTDWATMVAAATSSPAPHFTTNRFACLGTTDDEQSDSQPFTEVQSRRVKRRRNNSSPQQQQQQQQSQQQQSQSRGRRSARLLTGKNVVDNRGLGAAKKLVKKAVFCIDNVEPSYDVDDVKNFVSSLSVTVLSCFKAEPRRRRNEIGRIVDRKAFRLCIDDADRSLLLDDTKWPDSVTISEWYFIAPDERRQRASDPARASATVNQPTVSTAAAAAAMDLGASADNNDNGDSGDITVIYHDASTTSSSVVA